MVISPIFRLGSIAAAALGALIAAADSGMAAAPQVISVADAAGLQNAFATVPDGGVIELAAGTYAAPDGAFTIYNLALTKSFTVRAAKGATVVLSGGGTHDILRFGNPPQSTSLPIVFEGLTFTAGSSTTNFIGGAITLTQANAIFRSCTFTSNSANPSVSGGGVLWIDSSAASFNGCDFHDNSSHNYGAAFSALESQVFLSNCTVKNNRVNLPNHSPSSLGGAIANTNSHIRVDSCRFEANHAGLVGGAIFCGGAWRDPQSRPSAELIVSNSLFLNNSAAPDPSVNAPAPPVGGAIHLEDQTRGQFFNCRFISNSARQAGAISSYRAAVEIAGCRFEDNRAAGPGPGDSVGGSIYAQSTDLPDASTNFGMINRPSTTLTIRDTVFRGSSSSAPNALYGGAIYVSGDLEAAYGRGVLQNGTEESNRAPVSLTRVAFINLNTTGSAGALSGAFVTLSMDGCVFENCTTSGDSGAMRLVQGTVASIKNSTIARCRAESMGGGLLMFGGTLNISNSNLVENRVATGGAGAAMVTGAGAPETGIPARPLDGLVQQCVISRNTGSAMVYDGDGVTAPYNLLQYGSNQFFAADATVFYHSDVTGDLTVQQLNTISIPRATGPATIKTVSPNVLLTATPTVGALVLAPPTVLASGAPGESTPLSSALVYSSSGASAVVNGSAQSGSGGVLETTSDGVQRLSVGSSSYTTTPAPAAALNISTRLPIQNNDNPLIGGFIITGNAPKRVVVRGVGPALNAFGLPGLSDPVLELHGSTGAIVATSDNWKATQTGALIPSTQAVELSGTGVAPSSDLEPAMVVTLQPNTGYTAVVKSANGSPGIALVEAYDVDSSQASTLANISTRGFVQTGNDVMIGGFILGGGAAPSNVAVRAIGPSLSASGITNALADPTLELHDSNGATVDSNDDWSDPALTKAGLAPKDAREAAILRTNLPRGAYTAIVRGKGDTPGTGLLEVYVF